MRLHGKTGVLPTSATNITYTSFLLLFLIQAVLYLFRPHTPLHSAHTHEGRAREVGWGRRQKQEMKGSGYGVIEMPPRYFLEGTEQKYVKTVRITAVLSGIRTEHITNTSQERHRYANLRGWEKRHQTAWCVSLVYGN
jgi:hypothetical protein